MSHTLIAIDPGAISGAYAAFANGRGTTVGDLAAVDGQLDAVTFSRILGALKPEVAIIEKAGTMPGQGVVSAFKFGTAYGIIQGCLASKGIPLHIVTAGVWKKSLGLIHKDKEASRAMAIRLYPSVTGLHLKKHHNRAEALLIGHWYNHCKGNPLARPAWRGALWPAGKGDDDDD